MVDHGEGIVVEAVAEISFTTNGLAELPEGKIVVKHTAL